MLSIKLGKVSSRCASQYGVQRAGHEQVYVYTYKVGVGVLARTELSIYTAASIACMEIII